jgi:hypothetical protein
LLSCQHSIGHWQAGQVRLFDGRGENLLACRLACVNPAIPVPFVAMKFPVIRTAL